MEVRRWILAHALLAPNPHNRQPWLADLRQPGEILLRCDADRLLPETDPFGRQILIGCGAFIELAVLAAAERGYRLGVSLFPQGAPGPEILPGGTVVARLQLKQEAALARDPLFAQIHRRHTHKGLFDPARSVAPGQLQQILQACAGPGLRAGAVSSTDGMAALRHITRQAYEAEMTTPRTYLESAHLMRIGPAEVAQHRDGITLMSPMVRLMSTVGLFNRFEVPQRGGSNYDQAMKRWATFETASVYIWLVSEDNSRQAQIHAGRAYVRSHLQACALGLDMHPLSQALQEFPEVQPFALALREQLGLKAGASDTPQMLARLGYGLKPVSPSPRRALVDLLRG